MSSHPAIKDLFGIRIDKFLSSLSDEAKRKMWPIVNALRLELELSGSTTFPVPVDKLRRNRCSDEDTKAVLANLHRQGILSVSVRYKIKYRPDEFSVQTIDEHPEIYDYPQATISLKKEQLAYLYTKLELFVHPEKLAAAKNAIKILSTRNKTGQYSEIDNIVKRVEQECMAIEDGTSHRSLRDFWLNTKRVLDIICSKLYSGLDGQPKQEIPIQKKRGQVPFFGLPLFRNVDSSPSLSVILFTHSLSPNGDPRFKAWRIFSNFSSSSSESVLAHFS